jgi:hypothetical protein
MLPSRMSTRLQICALNCKGKDQAWQGRRSQNRGRLEQNHPNMRWRREKCSRQPDLLWILPRSAATVDPGRGSPWTEKFIRVLIFSFFQLPTSKPVLSGACCGSLVADGIIRPLIKITSYKLAKKCFGSLYIHARASNLCFNLPRWNKEIEKAMDDARGNIRNPVLRYHQHT